MPVYAFVRPFVRFSVALIFWLALSRLALVLWQTERISNTTDFFNLMVGGMRIDLCSAAYLFAVPALLHAWMTATHWHSKWLFFLRVWFFSCFMLVLFFELATPAFIDEYGFRPNRLFIEYLAYPKEVIAMLVHGHLGTLVIVLALLLLPVTKIWQFSLYLTDTRLRHTRVTGFSRIGAFVVLVALIVGLGRGTLGHRPINPAMVFFSTDPLVNSLTLNSTYSVAYALKRYDDEKNAAKLYGSLDEKRVIELVRQESKQPMESFSNTQLPTWSVRPAHFKGKPKNLVIILEESLGAQYVSSLGGIPITPVTDELMRQGWAFKRLYATGTRSVRGIEAVVTGFTPTPSRAVVKLDKSQKAFFTIAALLQREGYKTQFIYGGESHFDNMKSFFLGNGFSDIVDFDNIEDPDFVASWGASDEDLFKQADIELAKLHNSGHPFFSLIFTSSNHDPFEIPTRAQTPIQYSNEQLQQYDANELLRHKAIQYADYALGGFIAKAKTQPYWENTLFLIVADHDARVTGKELVPIHHFHIPGVILNSGREPAFDDRVVSQIDLAPTLLSLMGVENQSPMPGQDLTNPDAANRALMQYADNFAYLAGEEVTILQPGKAAVQFRYNCEQHTQMPMPANAERSEIALAHVLWGSLAYKNGWYGFASE